VTVGRRGARATATVAGGLAAALLAVACSSGAGGSGEVERRVEDITEEAPAISRYVALGDSFTSAPLVPSTDLADGCFRSDGNYPSLVAERLDVEEVVDVSCSGAATADLTRPQRTLRDATVPPQLDAVTPDTDLVTLGIGGNDFALFGTLVDTCTRLRAVEPTGSPCAARLEERGVDLVATADQISRRVERALNRVQRRAPDATVLLVGYLRLTPSEGRCRNLPFAHGDYAYGDRVARALDEALARAARGADVEYVDMHAASEGHDVCSDEPWVNGRRTLQGEALAFHPLAEGMEAVADEIVDLLSR
jgi:lysophospholipase L1-like esterase